MESRARPCAARGRDGGRGRRGGRGGAPGALLRRVLPAGALLRARDVPTSAPASAARAHVHRAH